jgi:hypothetical protein
MLFGMPGEAERERSQLRESLMSELENAPVLTADLAKKYDHVFGGHVASRVRGHAMLIRAVVLPKDIQSFAAAHDLF